MHFCAYPELAVREPARPSDLVVMSDETRRLIATLRTKGARRAGNELAKLMVPRDS